MAKISTAIAKGLAALLMVGLGCTAFGEIPNDVVAVGPLELVDPTSVTVLGRSYRIENTAGLVAGDKVAVHGSLQPDGSVTNAWAESLGAYSAGSDPVFETGVVTGVNETFGRLSIGDSKIDYTAALSESESAAPVVGEMVAVTGIQPTLGGVILGTTTSASTAEVQLTLAGSSARGGISIAGISGTSRAIAGISGTSQLTSGISGTSRLTAGISGTSRVTAGISGTSQLTSGISGTSRLTAGISGTSRVTAGISGTSQLTSGISGTSQLTSGISGTSQLTSGISGTSRVTR
jgi:hypothetical protein